MASGTLRFRQNFQCLDQNKLRRGCGWKKLLSNTSYNNEDFHDQLLSLSNDEDFTSIRQPITLLFEAESTRKVRNLIAAKQGAIAKLNEYSGNWRILGTGYGGEQTTSAAAPRFHCAQVGDFLAFTNDFESPMYHRLEDVSVAGSPLIQPFPDLATIGLSRAGVVWAWRNCLFFADVEMDGKRFAYRLIWSDFDNPTAFDPADRTDRLKPVTLARTYRETRLFPGSCPGRCRACLRPAGRTCPPAARHPGAPGAG